MRRTTIVAGAVAATALLGTTSAAAAGSPTWSINSVTARYVGHGPWNGATGCFYNVKVNFNHGTVANPSTQSPELRIYRWKPGDKIASDSQAIVLLKPGKNSVYTFHMGAANGERVYFKVYLWITRVGGPLPITKAYRLVDHDTNPRTITPWTCHV